jgi:SOS-response transcriptional repressor LexA
MAIKDTLRRLMDDRQITGYALSEYTKVPQPTIHRILTGESRDPKTQTLEPIAAFFGLTVSQLRDLNVVGGSGGTRGDSLSRDQASPNPENAPVIEPSSLLNVRYAPPQRAAVPVISAIQAGRMKEIGYVPELGAGDRFESPEHKLGARGWAMVVEGDSMDDGTDKGIPAGWLIFVDPDIAPTPNSYVIAKDVATQAATFKKLVYDAGRWYLRPLNRQYQAIEIDSPELRVIGVVTEARPPSRRLA